MRHGDSASIKAGPILTSSTMYCTVYYSTRYCAAVRSGLFQSLCCKSAPLQFSSAVQEALIRLRGAFFIYTSIQADRRHYRQRAGGRGRKGEGKRETTKLLSEQQVMQTPSLPLSHHVSVTVVGLAGAGKRLTFKKGKEEEGEEEEEEGVAVKSRYVGCQGEGRIRTQRCTGRRTMEQPFLHRCTAQNFYCMCCL